MSQTQALDFFNQVNDILWGWPMLIILVTTALILTLGLRALQVTQFKYAWELIFCKKEHPASSGDITHLQALMTALSATVGTGNIAGVATAIAMGGPGAIFWMWMTGLLGMATKFSEAILGIHFRIRNENGTMSGGPMYYIRHGLGSPFLASLFAAFMAIAALNLGNMIQSNSVADIMESTFNVSFEMTGIILAVTTGLVILGGITRIAKVASAIVPVMIAIYVAAALYIVAVHAPAIPEAFALIFKGAFSGTAAVGGFMGAAVKTAMQLGLARGVFSNESGLGSAPIAAAAAKTTHPTEQALVSMLQTFIDTLVVCTLTALVILTTGVWTGGENGASLTGLAFSSAFPDVAGVNIGSIIVSISLMFFAYSTLLGWCYYGEKATEYLMGVKSIIWYRMLFIACIFAGSIMQLELVWAMATTVTGLMILPNLYALVRLRHKVYDLTKDYLRYKHVDEKPYENPFHFESK